MASPPLSPRRTALAWGRLLRLSLAPSAVADAVAGTVLGAGAWPAGPRPFLLVGASLAVYHGGLVLNDWADRGADRLTRPERPIPSGRIAPGAALAVGLALLALGAFLAFRAGRIPGLLLGSVAVLAAAYDLVGRGPWSGPLLLGLCRGGNLGAGVALGLALGGGAGAAAWRVLPIPLLYGAYVFVVSRLGRLEDGADAGPLGRRPSRLLALAGALLVLLPLLPVPAPRVGAGDLVQLRVVLAFAVVAGGALGLLRLARRPGAWTRPEVMRAMGAALRRLIVFDAACALLVGSVSGLVAGLALLLGLPLSFGLRRAFPPS